MPIEPAIWRSSSSRLIADGRRSEGRPPPSPCPLPPEGGEGKFVVNAVRLAPLPHCGRGWPPRQRRSGEGLGARKASSSIQALWFRHRLGGGRAVDEQREGMCAQLIALAGTPQPPTLGKPGRLGGIDQRFPDL